MFTKVCTWLHRSLCCWSYEHGNITKSLNLLWSTDGFTGSFPEKLQGCSLYRLQSHVSGMRKKQAANTAPLLANFPQRLEKHSVLP